MLLAMSGLALSLKRMKSADSNSRRRSIKLALAACGISHVVLKTLYFSKRITVIFPSQGMQDLNEDTFEKMFRFRQEDFNRVLAAMSLCGKYLQCGKAGKHFRVPAHIGMLVLLSRLAFPCRFLDLFETIIASSYSIRGNPSTPLMFQFF
jgi:hypothetical protein